MSRAQPHLRAHAHKSDAARAAGGRRREESRLSDGTSSPQAASTTSSFWSLSGSLSFGLWASSVVHKMLLSAVVVSSHPGVTSSSSTMKFALLAGVTVLGPLRSPLMGPQFLGLPRLNTQSSWHAAGLLNSAAQASCVRHVLPFASPHHSVFFTLTMLCLLGPAVMLRLQPLVP